MVRHWDAVPLPDISMVFTAKNQWSNRAETVGNKNILGSWKRGVSKTINFKQTVFRKLLQSYMSWSQTEPFDCSFRYLVLPLARICHQRPQFSKAKANCPCVRQTSVSHAKCWCLRLATGCSVERLCVSVKIISLSAGSAWFYSYPLHLNLLCQITIWAGSKFAKHSNIQSHNFSPSLRLMTMLMWVFLSGRLWEWRMMHTMTTYLRKILCRGYLRHLS